MDPLKLVEKIYSLAATIHDQFKKVKANQEQCKLLYERVAVIIKAIKELSSLSETEAFSTSLKRLIKCLEDISEYMYGLSGISWFRRLFLAGDHEAQFKSFTTSLDQARSDLGLALSAQALINQEKDHKATQADQKDLSTKQKELIQLNEKMLLEMNKIPDKDFHQRQMDSIRQRLDQLVLAKKEEKGLDPKIVIPYFALTLEADLGQGTFGKIYRGKWQDTEVAIKVWNGKLTEKEKQQFIRETQILQRLRTPLYIPQFYGACLETSRACIVIELCSLGSLDKYLVSHRLSSEQQRTLALSIAKGLNFLHENGVVHRYFKSANVLLNESKSGEALQAKITGFGLSKTEYPSVVTAPLQLEDLLTGIAPEVLEGKEVTKAADVFNYGTVLWELLTSRRAFATTSPKELKEGYQEDCSHLHPDYAKLIQDCWSLNPKQRPSLEDVVLRLSTLPLPSILSKLPLVLSSTATVTMTATPQSTSASTSVTATIPLGFSSGIFSNVHLTAYEQGKAYHEKKDYKNARYHYEIALEAGEDRDYVPLAALLIRGNGGKPEELKTDQVRAVKLFEAEAQKGNVRAMENLAIAYDKGVGVTKDVITASEWRTKSKAIQSQSLRLSSVPAVRMLSPQTASSVYISSSTTTEYSH